MRPIWCQLALAIVIGCAAWTPLLEAGSGDESKDRSRPAATASQDQEKGDHSAWWCAEHGVPEEVCSQCDRKIAAACKKKGDWCKEHDRADSQCFKCHPKLKEKYAAQYRAKYGQEPPPTTEDKETKEKGGR